MSSEALAIARELAQLLEQRRSTPLHAIPTPHVENPVNGVENTRCALSRAERAIAAEQTRLLREFFQARYYARLRVQARRGKGAAQ